MQQQKLKNSTDSANPENFGYINPAAYEGAGSMEAGHSSHGDLGDFQNANLMEVDKNLEDLPDVNLAADLWNPHGEEEKMMRLFSEKFNPDLIQDPSYQTGSYLE